MKFPPSSPSARFSAAAPHYDREAGVQRAAARAVLNLVPTDLRPDRILDLGCGSGQLTALLLERWPDAHVVAVDAAPGMIAEAKRRFAGEDRIRWVEADAAQFQPDPPCPLVVSNCALHWLHPLENGLRHTASLVARGGVLACSVMLRGTLRELHAARHRAAPAKPPMALMPSMEYLEAVWSQEGLTILDAHREERRLFAGAVSDILAGLRLTGVTGGPLSRGPAPLTRSELKALEKAYPREPDGRVAATYVVGYILAERL